MDNECSNVYGSPIHYFSCPCPASSCEPSGHYFINIQWDLDSCTNYRSFSDGFPNGRPVVMTIWSVFVSKHCIVWSVPPLVFFLFMDCFHGKTHTVVNYA